MTSLIPTNTEIHLFDMHTNLQPIDRPEFFSPEFRFLGNPLDYDYNYENQDFSMKTVHFSTIRPLKESEIKFNHFWKRLQSQTAWGSHLPLVAKPVSDFSVNFVVKDLGLNLPVHTWIFLWPWGWSTNLFVKLEGEIPLLILAELTASFKSACSRGMFVLDGKASSPSLIFKRLGDWIARDVYIPFAVSQTRISLEKHFILSIIASSGETFPYDPDPTFNTRQRMAVRDRSLLHSILLGRSVSAEELKERESQEKRPFLLTKFSGKAFAITDYEHGSVLVLCKLKPAEEQAEHPNREHCMTGNIRSCAMLTFGLAAVLEDEKFYSKPGVMVKRLIDAAREFPGHMWRLHKNYLWGGYILNPRMTKFL